MLGHGHKVGFEGELSLERITEDLLPELPQEPFWILGHSFGIRAGLRLCDLYPKRVQGLIVEDSAPMISQNGFNEIMSIFESTPESFATREAARDYFLTHWDERFARFLLSHIRELSPGQHRWRFQSAKLKKLMLDAKKESLWDSWAAFEGPIAMILGERSYVSAERIEECRSLRAGKPFEVVQIAQSGHWVHADQPDLFCEQVVRLLKMFS